MKIFVTGGCGTGTTELGAFDQALIEAGVANYNLIYLSSVMPPNSEVIEDKLPKEFVGEWGDRLYVVIAQQRVSTVGTEAWAGIGWVQQEGSKKGLFVEHEGHSEAEVRRAIKESLKILKKGRPEEKFGPIHMKVQGLTCEKEPICALVVAAFQAHPWGEV